MQVVLGLLTILLTVLYLLDRLGIDLGGLNPFYWRRRRAWAAKYQGDPIYSVEDPMHVAALIIVGAAKLDGELSSEQKKIILTQFKSKFSLDTQAASELLGSAAHLLGAPQVIDNQLDGVVHKSKDRFSKDQAESMLNMMVEVLAADGDLNSKQSAYIASVRSLLVPPDKSSSTW